MATDKENHQRYKQQQQQQPFIPRGQQSSQRSNYLVMLNNFASDLDVLLSDLSQSCPLTESPQIITGRRILQDGREKDCDGDVTVHYNHGNISGLGEKSNQSQVIMPLLTDLEARPIDFRERLDKSLPIWYLPSIGRIGAVHLLKDGLPGMFIVRESSRKDAMALSVHLCQESGPIVEHYLIENYSIGPHLQGATKIFSNVPDLIYNYSQNLEDLPQLLVLPEPIMKAKTSQELTSLALLGQDFWSSALMKKSVAAYKKKDDKTNRQKSNLQKSSSFEQKNPKLNVPEEKLYDIKNEKKLPTFSIDAAPTSESEDPFVTSFTNSRKNKKHLSSEKNGNKNEQKVKSSCSDSHLPVLCQSGINIPSHSDNGADAITAKVHRSNTHPQINVTVKEQKSNLYSSTSIDLLTVHQYFRSNLSDKLSDYEDVWKSCPAKNVDNECCKKLCDDETEEPHIKRTIPTDLNQPVEDLYTLSTHDARFKKFAAENVYTKKAHKVKIQRTTSNPQKIGQYKDRHSPETWPSPSADNSSCFVCRRGSTGQTLMLNIHEEAPSLKRVPAKNAKTNKGRLDIQTERENKPSNFFDNSEIQFSLRIPEKTKPAPLPALSQVSKFYTQNMKSPVYTEPFDSIGLQPVIVPAATSNNDLSSLKANHPHRDKRKSHVSYRPNLETIYSPSVVPNSNVFSFDKYKIQNGKMSNDVNNNDKDNSHKEQIQELDTQNDPKYSERETLHLNPKFTEKIFEVIDNCDTKSNIHTLNKFPVYDKMTLNSKGSETDCSTLGDMVRRMSPELTLEPMLQCDLVDTRASEYDNLQCRAVSMISDTGTVFSKPWDSTKWDNLLSCDDPKLLPAINPLERIQVWRESSQDYESSKRFSQLSQATSDVLALPASVKAQRLEQKVMREILSGVEDSEKHTFSQTHSKLFEEHLNSCKSPGENLKEFILRLAEDQNDTFGLAVKNFVECTLESQEQNPHSVMRNMRQFMTGIKNYLLHNSQEGLNLLIERESSRLGTNEILNIDAIIESALHECVILPLKEHVYQLLATDYTRNGSVSTLHENIVYARTRPLSDLGLRGHLSPPDKEDLEQIREYLGQIQQAYSPIKKLKNLLKASFCITSCLNGHSKNGRASCSVQTDDFLPMLTYVIVNAGLVSAEIEADYMWGLLHTSQVSADANYYLSTLSSAVLLLKNFKTMQQNQSGYFGRLPSISDMQGFLKVAFPDEICDSIIWKTLPVRPNMTTRDVCAMIAHKFRITNPQDYDLYILINGQEKALNETVCPQSVKMETMNSGKECVFAFKRKASNIAWPRKLRTT